MRESRVDSLGSRDPSNRDIELKFSSGVVERFRVCISVRRVQHFDGHMSDSRFASRLQIDTLEH